MKVVCIDDYTFGRMVSWYDASLFIPIDELRENKLNELGI
jgi:hypothetical protein